MVHDNDVVTTCVFPPMDRANFAKLVLSLQ